MRPDVEHLNRLLRLELTAVNQQFSHVLALRAWGDEETAARIMAVDYVDFPNAMRIIDHLVRTGLPVSIDSERPDLGTTRADMLETELAFEKRMSAAIEAADFLNGPAAELVANARAPREAYAGWLGSQLDNSGDGQTPEDNHFPEASGVFSHLIVFIEQTLVHAFVHWHARDVENADGAWASCGAAMLRATELVRLFAAHNTLPRPGEMPALKIATDPAAALNFDRTLAGRCAGEAARAAEACPDAAIADLCRKIARQSVQMSEWKTGAVHPVAGDNSPKFASFGKTLQKYVPAAA